MQTIFVMAKCDLGKAYDVTGRIQLLPGVKDAFTMITFKAFS